MSSDGQLIAIEAKAAEWMGERDRGLSREGEQALAQSLADGQRHPIILNALAETWSLIGEARRVALESDAHAYAPQRRRRLSWLPVRRAAAAAVALAWLGAWRFADVRHAVDSPFAMASVTEVGVLRKVALP